MTWLNEHEIENLQTRFDPEDCPKLVEATRALARLVNWTNQNSDGWPYWKLPAKAAGKLMDRLELAEDARRRNGAVDDLTDDEWSRLFRPIRQFLSDRKVDDPDMVLFPKPPEPDMEISVSGNIRLGGVLTAFSFNAEGEYTQWGPATTGELGARVSLLEAMGAAYREWREENVCRTCQENLLDDGEGYDGECGNCADQTEGKKQDEDEDLPISVRPTWLDGKGF